MLGKAIIVSLTTAAFWGNVANAQYSPQRAFDTGIIRSFENENARKRIAPDAEAGQNQGSTGSVEPGQTPQQESRFCQNPSFQGSDSTTLKTRRMLGCKE